MQSDRVPVGSAVQTSLIHGGPYFTLKATAANLMVPDTTAHQEGGQEYRPNSHASLLQGTMLTHSPTIISRGSFQKPAHLWDIGSTGTALASILNQGPWSCKAAYLTA